MPPGALAGRRPAGAAAGVRPPAAAPRRAVAARATGERLRGRRGSHAAPQCGGAGPRQRQPPPQPRGRRPPSSAPIPPLGGLPVGDLWIPDPLLDVAAVRAAAGAPGAVASAGGGGRARRRGPPDLPSLLMDGRIVYLGMPVRDRGDKEGSCECGRADVRLDHPSFSCLSSSCPP